MQHQSERTAKLRSKSQDTICHRERAMEKRNLKAQITFFSGWCSIKIFYKKNTSFADPPKIDKIKELNHIQRHPYITKFTNFIYLSSKFSESKKNRRQ